jgi:hypothetical protein
MLAVPFTFHGASVVSQMAEAERAVGNCMWRLIPSIDNELVVVLRRALEGKPDELIASKEEYKVDLFCSLCWRMPNFPAPQDLRKLTFSHSEKEARAREGTEGEAKARGTGGGYCGAGERSGHCRERPSAGAEFPPSRACVA